MAGEEQSAVELVALAVRTLLASGFEISRSTRISTHLEIEAEREDAFGALQTYSFALTDSDEFGGETTAAIVRAAEREGRAPVLVGRIGTATSRSFEEFFQALGGAVPAWRALTEEYESALCIAAANELPPGMSGEAWFLFEELVGDGLEFVFGRRVRRLGGLSRGKPVTDMLAVLPDLRLLVVDAKATGTAFDANRANLRALGEYTQRQIKRQQGKNEVFGAVVVSAGFKQEPDRLAEVSQEFLADYGKPCAFVPAASLAATVREMRREPLLRNSVEWHKALSGGAVPEDRFATQIQRARDESITVE